MIYWISIYENTALAACLHIASQTEVLIVPAGENGSERSGYNGPVQCSDNRITGDQRKKYNTNIKANPFIIRNATLTLSWKAMRSLEC